MCIRDRLEFEGLQASPEQQEILSRYVGWGGLADAFDEKDVYKRQLTDSAIAKLRRMSDAEYEALDLFPEFEKEDTDAE